MTDYFALFAVPRRPWLDPEPLKQKFLVFSGSLHPDKANAANESEKTAATRTFSEMNAAYKCLMEPKSRLLHLLELEMGTRPREIQQIPDKLADLFAEVATVCNSADGFLKEKAQNASPMLAVQWFERGQEWIERLQALKNKLGVWHGELDDNLKALDAVWLGSEPGARQQVLPALEELYRRFGYFNRWNNQVQERMAQLAL
ncbi:MAG: hypothetical protein ACLQSR_08770 [Limisphaerales bacterium]